MTDLAPYLPSDTKSQGCIIITTQRPQSQRITKDFYVMELQSLNEERGAKLLFSYLERDPTDETGSDLAHEISAIVGGLPLAITTIGGYINDSGSSLKEFLGIMKQSSNAWEETHDKKLKNYERTLSTVFEIALKELPSNARNLIIILAFLNPDSIPEEILLAVDDSEEVKFLSNRAE